MIESLKQNKTAFGLCSKEEQECLIEVGPENCQVFNKEWEQKTGKMFYLSATYRIKSDYGEPQIERCEVRPNNFGYLRYYGRLESGGISLHDALSDPDFMYFEFEDGKKATVPRKSKEHDKSAEIPKFVVFRKKDK